MFLPTKNQVNTGVRYATVAITTAFALLGLQAKGISLDQVKTGIQALGDITNNVVILITLVGGVWAAAKGVNASSPVNQIASVQAIATDKTSPVTTEAKDALVAATISLPQVQTIVTDKVTAEASPSASVVAAS